MTTQYCTFNCNFNLNAFSLFFQVVNRQVLNHHQTRHKTTMAKVLDYFTTAIIHPDNDSIQTYFIYTAIMLCLTAFIAIAIIALYFLNMWVNKQWQLRRQRMDIAEIACEVFGLEILG